MKIGIYAGTFDPIHDGHVQFAITAVEKTELDKVIIVAEKNPYRKEPVASWDHRQAMIERASEGLNVADHDYAFSAQLSHQHTMQNILQTAKKHYGQEHEFWFLVGSDIFEHMKRWEDVALQHEYGGFVVALRDDHTRQWLSEKIAELKETGFPVRVEIIDNKKPHISSKKIRDTIASGGPPVEICQQVREYVGVHGLYKN